MPKPYLRKYLGEARHWITVSRQDGRVGATGGRTFPPNRHGPGDVAVGKLDVKSGLLPVGYINY